MNKIDNKILETNSIFPIKREDMLYGELVNSTNTKRRSVLFTYPKNQKFSSPEMKNHFAYKPFDKKSVIDLNYIGPEYELCTTSQTRENICYDYNTLIHLDFLLKYFGFEEQLGIEEYLECLNTLFNGKFPYEKCEDFEYHWYGETYWKNGRLIENAQTKYNTNYYQKIQKIGYESPSLLSKYFKILTKINYQNPTEIWTPMEEEINIKKRILK